MKRKLLLLVEDNHDEEDLILRALGQSGLTPQIIVARDGVEALEYLHSELGEQTHARLPDLILLDLNLPGKSGFEVLRQIRANERTRVLPVVVLTSSQAEGDIASSYDLGASSYVNKPIESERFMQTIRQVGSYWLALNVAAPLEPTEMPDRRRSSDRAD
jgi:CheY-like chemotaxis protein